MTQSEKQGILSPMEEKCHTANTHYMQQQSWSMDARHGSGAPILEYLLVIEHKLKGTLTK